MDPASSAIAYRFEGFVLDLARGALLTHAGHEIPIRRQSYRLLRLLVTNSARLLDRDAIHAAIWADVAVSDDSITQCIHEIRRALGDEARQILRTVPGRGYMLAARVTPVGPDHAPSPPADLERKSDDPLINAPRLSVAVLPFDNLGRADDRLVDGITDDLITDISGLPEFHVVDRSSTSEYRGRAIDVRRLGRELGVRYAIEGSVRVNQSQLRINAQIVSTETGTNIWAGRFDVRRFKAQPEIDGVVRQIVVAANARILAAESDRGTRDRPDNLNTTDILLQARALRCNMAHSSQQWVRVISLYQQAVERDPSSIMALTGLASALIDTTDNKAEDPSAPVKYRRADDLIRQAELSRHDDVEVMCARVYLLGKQGRYTELVPIAQRAIELYPNRTSFSLWLATALMRTGMAAEAIPLLEREMRLDPHSAWIYSRYELMGYALAFLGRYEDAVSWFQKSLAAHPNMGMWTRGQVYSAIAAAHALVGQADEARANAGKACRAWPTLTARSFHTACNIIGSVAAAQVSRLRAGLRRAGVRDCADEDADFGIESDNSLDIAYEGPTPTTAPGARTLRTNDLVALMAQCQPLVLDTVPWGNSVPGATGLWGAGIGGTVSDEFQDRLRSKMLELTGGDTNRPVVTMGWNSERFQGRNLALRLVALGHTNVCWYRGGREAWETAALPKAGLAMQDW